MNTCCSIDSRAIARDVAFELRFASLFDEGRGYAFPCDEQGHVDMDTLSERALANYLCARTLIGRDFATPCVLRVH